MSRFRLWSLALALSAAGPAIAQDVPQPREHAGLRDSMTVRGFSEGARRTGTAQQAQLRNDFGGEVDSPSRNLARCMASIAEQHLPDFRVRLV